ncbi:MAG: hypothetical protein C4532_08615 [Candidatus Abyssobacteria bacterium SURF_17]|uniref:Uncharacterized protein n=1 Tax=Candidatus Abyssobacteria bacterium SURF_17 TaxID=2093361 RepID=A0A419EZF3_9BACT|nr:MAG: hypothetical protein C4532_08615 [Candidatus Abyssubacteria bacterium SURF_17]
MQGDGTFGEKIQSLARIIMEYINSQGGVMEETDLEQIIRDSDRSLDAEAHQSRSDSSCHIAPSIKNPASTPISAEEARDFLRIDLNLLSKREYFDKFFG